MTSVSGQSKQPEDWSAKVKALETSIKKMKQEEKAEIGKLAGGQKVKVKKGKSKRDFALHFPKRAKTTKTRKSLEGKKITPKITLANQTVNLLENLKKTEAQLQKKTGADNTGRLKKVQDVKQRVKNLSVSLSDSSVNMDETKIAQFAVDIISFESTLNQVNQEIQINEQITDLKEELKSTADEILRNSKNKLITSKMSPGDIKELRQAQLGMLEEMQNELGHLQDQLMSMIGKDTPRIDVLSYMSRLDSSKKYLEDVKKELGEIKAWTPTTRSQGVSRAPILGKHRKVSDTEAATIDFHSAFEAHQDKLHGFSKKVFGEGPEKMSFIDHLKDKNMVSSEEYALLKDIDDAAKKLDEKYIALNKEMPTRDPVEAVLVLEQNLTDLNEAQLEYSLASAQVEDLLKNLNYREGFAPLQNSFMQKNDGLRFGDYIKSLDTVPYNKELRMFIEKSGLKGDSVALRLEKQVAAEKMEGRFKLELDALQMKEEQFAQELGFITDAIFSDPKDPQKKITLADYLFKTKVVTSTEYSKLKKMETCAREVKEEALKLRSDMNIEEGKVVTFEQVDHALRESNTEGYRKAISNYMVVYNEGGGKKVLDRLKQTEVVRQKQIQNKGLSKNQEKKAVEGEGLGQALSILNEQRKEAGLEAIAELDQPFVRPNQKWPRFGLHYTTLADKASSAEKKEKIAAKKKMLLKQGSEFGLNPISTFAEVQQKLSIGEAAFGSCINDREVLKTLIGKVESDVKALREKGKNRKANKLEKKLNQMKFYEMTKRGDFEGAKVPLQGIKRTGKKSLAKILDKMKAKQEVSEKEKAGINKLMTAGETAFKEAMGEYRDATGAFTIKGDSFQKMVQSPGNFEKVKTEYREKVDEKLSILEAKMPPKKFANIKKDAEAKFSNAIAKVKKEQLAEELKPLRFWAENTGNAKYLDAFQELDHIMSAPGLTTEHRAAKLDAFIALYLESDSPKKLDLGPITIESEGKRKAVGLRRLLHARAVELSKGVREGKDMQTEATQFKAVFDKVLTEHIDQKMIAKIAKDAKTV